MDQDKLVFRLKEFYLLEKYQVDYYQQRMDQGKIKAPMAAPALAVVGGHPHWRGH